MNREDVRKLLGGYATGTLSQAEREALFAAALDDQELFDALMKEEALREVFEEPGTKAQLLAALEKPAKQPAWWSWRPLIGAVAMAGIALTAVAIWRGNRNKPSQVMVAEVTKEAPAPAPAATPPPATIQPATPVKSRARTEPQAARDERRQEKEKDNTAFADQAAPSAKAELQGRAAPAAAPPAVARQQQVGQIAAPSPMVQQQASQAIPTAQSAAVEAAPLLNRNAGASGFRAANPVKEASADMLMTKKVLGPLQWAILRGDQELPPGTALGAGEAVRLRIFSSLPGTITLSEGDKTLASGAVDQSKPFDTPAIPFTAPGLRQLRLNLATGAPQPMTLDITLNYAR